MKDNTQHDLQGAWDLAGNAIKATSLEVALKRSLFDALTEPKSLEQISEQLGLNPVAAEPWLNLLWSMGYLLRTNDTVYEISSVTRKYLLKDAEHSCVKAVLFRLETLKQFSERFDVLLQRDDRPSAKAADVSEGWANAAKAQIFEEQRAVTVPAFKRLLENLPELKGGLSNPLRWLDLGAGAGLISIAFLQRFSNATGVAFDLPETASVAKDNITRVGLERRLAVQSGDLNIDFPLGAFDVVWCSSVFHFLERYESVLAKISTCLSSHGVALLLHAEQTHDAEESEQVLPFYAPMVMKGNLLPKRDEVLVALRNAGLTCLRSVLVTDFPMAPIWLHVCTRKSDEN